MATVAAAAPEHIEAMEQVEGAERAAGAAAAADDDDAPTEALEQVGGDEAATAAAAADDDAAEPMEQGEGEEAAEIDAEEEADASAEAHMEASEQAEEEEREEVHAVAGEEEAEAQPLQTVLPLGRVKRIMRVDSEIKKVTAEASLLIAAATELFLGSLAAGAHTAASQGGRRTVRAAHVRAAVRAHRPTADFLLDCLPAAAEAAPRVARSGSDGAAAVAEAAVPKPLPRGTRRIDGFFQKVT
ncbi:nuclear transcription factor Y subunit C-6-like [Triticum dicoccoides]|nr:nuclear transcription factor Y subunit C-6-like [Triticum dicoccoides]XP_044344330.1 nuclear transcription factor Y subunit C-6-like [Triticum aestivum]